MLALAVLAFGRALAYLQPATPGFTPNILIDLMTVIPIPVYGILWGVTGLVLTVAAFRQHHANALAVAAGASILWAMVYIHAAITRAGENGFTESIGSWITATNYAATAVIIVCLSKLINKVERVQV